VGTLLQNVVNFVFLLLAVALLIILWGSTQDNVAANNLLEQIEMVRDENRKVIGNNTTFLEQKINSLAKVQNDYQFSTSRKITLLENKVEQLSKKEPKQRLINNNSLHNSLTINGTDVQVKKSEATSETKRDVP
jgi:hypothetical protein